MKLGEIGVRIAALAATWCFTNGIAQADLVTVNTRPASGSGSCLFADSDSAASGPIISAQNCSSVGFDAIRTVRANARADYGSVGASTAVDLITSSSLENSGIAQANAQAFYVFTGPGTHVNTRLNLNLAGGLSVSGIFFSEIRITVAVNGVEQGVRIFLGPSGVQLLNNSLIDPSSNWGIFTSLSGGALTLQTAALNLPVGSPVNVFMELMALGSGLGPGNARAEFANTLTFNPSGDVFELPDGFTVNGANVVNNVWTGADTGVPEPATWTLAAAGVGLLVLLRRR
ncbi:MAG: hypothetical protein JNL62_07915 [Bryobacterales bacterium]|nr:hypothetical protein [Bryobacterales bacterium]